MLLSLLQPATLTPCIILVVWIVTSILLPVCVQLSKGKTFNPKVSCLVLCLKLGFACLFHFLCYFNNHLSSHFKFPLPVFWCPQTLVCLPRPDSFYLLCPIIPASFVYSRCASSPLYCTSSSMDPSAKRTSCFPSVFFICLV